MASSPWPQAYGLWHMAHGPWPMAYGPQPMAHGLRPTAHGPCMVHDLGLMAYGLCSMAYGLRLLAYGLWHMVFAYGLWRSLAPPSSLPPSSPTTLPLTSLVLHPPSCCVLSGGCVSLFLRLCHIGSVSRNFMCTSVNTKDRFGRESLDGALYKGV